MSSVKDAVDVREQAARENSWFREEGPKSLGIILGTVIYAVGVNYFLRPLHLYSGGFMGFSQLFTTLLRDYLGVNIGHLDLSGIIYYILNIPGLLIALFSMRRRFFFKTIFTVTCITLVLTLVPIPAAPMLDEKIANCLVAGLMAGIGVGLILRMGACDGGMDLIGMILVQKKGRFSIGRINICTNLVLYGVCLLLFDIPTVIYSLLYSVACSLMCDRIHIQNINVQALIVTKLQNIEPLEIELMGQMHRGLTRWNAVGGYTGSDETIMMTVISKYEINQLKTIVHQCDPHAFVMIDEGVSVQGNFKKKLV